MQLSTYTVYTMQYINTVDFTQPRKTATELLVQLVWLYFLIHLVNLLVLYNVRTCMHDQEHYFYIWKGQGHETEFKYFYKSKYFYI